jgi:hypothetical protein
VLKLPSYLAFYLLLVCPKRAKLPSYLTKGCLMLAYPNKQAQIEASNCAEIDACLFMSPFLSLASLP